LREDGGEEPRVSRGWIAGELGEAAFAQLADGLGGSELQSVLLEVMSRRAAARAPREVLAQYRRDRFVAPAAVDQRTSIAVDAHLLAAAEGFEAVELSPVAPLGTCSTVALTTQHRVLSALRGTELVSDPTNVFALEIAARWQAPPGVRDVHLVTSQRVVRAQPVPKLPGYAQHFRIYVLGTGGIEQQDHAFTVASLVRHITTMSRALDLLERHGFAFGARRLDLLHTPERTRVAERIAAALPLAAALRPLEQPYYSGGLRYMLWLTAPDGKELPLVDGGAFDWLAKLTSNRRAVYVASGAGAQLIPLVFRR
jgi:hypothetical protein